MSEEPCYFGDDRARPGARLPPRRGNADDDVAEQETRGFAQLTFPLGEREHVGGSIDSAIVAVQLLDLIIARKEDRDLAFAHFERFEHRADASDHVRVRNAWVGTGLNDELNGHARRVTSTLHRCKGRR